MTFLVPWVLYFVPIPLLLWVFWGRRQRRSTYGMFAPEVLGKLSHGHAGLSQRVRTLVLVLALTLMILALAQPVIEKERVKISQQTVDLIIGIDISVSMEAKDLFPNRLEWAKKKILELIDRSDGLRVGVMAFAANAYVVTPLTSDKEVAQFLITNLDTESITEKGTDILQLVDAASAQMQKQNHKTLLLVTDGGDEPHYEKVIALAKEKEMTVFVLGVGTQAGAPIETKEGGFIKQNGKIVLTQLNASIKEIARQTGGSYIETVPSVADVEAMLGEIKNSVKAQETASDEVRRLVELFGYFLVAAALLLLAGLGSLPRGTAVAAFMLFPTIEHAGMVDFIDIGEAKSAYEAGDFNRSGTLYSDVLASNPTPEAAYNLGNARYKQGDYEAAASAFASIDEKSPFAPQALHNLGNSLAMTQKYEEAIKAYEKALTLAEDAQTRENLEAVRKMVQKQKEQNQENKKEDPSKQGEQNDDQKEQSQEKKENKEKNDQKSDSQSDQNENDDQAKPEEKEQPSQNKEAKPQEDQAKKADAEDEPKAAESVDQKPQASQAEMTDKQEEKVLEMLNAQKGTTYRYQIQTEQKKEHYEKPW